MAVAIEKSGDDEISYPTDSPLLINARYAFWQVTRPSRGRVLFLLTSTKP